MEANDTINSFQADFDAEIKRRNSIIRTLGYQNDSLHKSINERQSQLDALDKQLETKQQEIDKIDSIFEEKMADFNAHVEAVQKSLKEKEEELTEQKSKQSFKERAQSDKDLEIAGRVNKLESAKEGIIKSLQDHLDNHSDSIKEAIESIKEL